VNEYKAADTAGGEDQRQQEHVVPKDIYSVVALVILCALCSCGTNVPAANNKAPDPETPNVVSPLNYPPPVLYPYSSDVPKH
jgi:hypothetical protein